MKAVFLIGNGFDINAGLDTKSTKVIKHYKKHLDLSIEEHEDKNTEAPQSLLVLQRAIEEDYETWADFEIALGKVTAEYEVFGQDAGTLFSEALNHFRDYLAHYMQAQENYAGSKDLSEQILAAFNENHRHFFADAMRDQQKGVLQDLIMPHQKENWETGFIVFNYTTLIDRLVDASVKSEKIKQSLFVAGHNYSRSFGTVLHAHGTLSDDLGLLVGVDSENQIIGESCRTSDVVTEALVKPVVNNGCGDLREKKAKGILADSCIVCIYGISMGESDLTWLKIIGEWLCNNPLSKLLVIARQKPKRMIPQPESFMRTVRATKELFISRALISEEDAEIIRDRILVSLGTTCFDIGLEKTFDKAGEVSDKLLSLHDGEK